MTNWKKSVNQMHAETFKLPPGWDSKATIAESLDCSEEKVADWLAPGVKSGKYKKQSFKVWDATLERHVMVTAYQEVKAEAEPATPKQTIDVATIKKLKAAGKTWKEMGEIFGRSGDSVRAFYQYRQ